MTHETKSHNVLNDSEFCGVVSSILQVSKMRSREWFNSLLTLQGLSSDEACSMFSFSFHIWFHVTNKRLINFSKVKSWKLWVYWAFCLILSIASKWEANLKKNLSEQVLIEINPLADFSKIMSHFIFQDLQLKLFHQKLTFLFKRMKSYFYFPLIKSLTNQYRIVCLFVAFDFAISIIKALHHYGLEC